jgi:hypothetical protein
MGRRVRPVSREGIESLSDAALAAYIADTKFRVARMTKASLRKDYADQLRLAEEVKAQRAPLAETAGRR